MGQSFEKGAGDIIRTHLTHITQGLVVAACHGLFWRAELEFAQVFLKEFGLHAVAPDFIGFIESLRPGGFLTVQLNLPLALEIVFFCREFLVSSHAVLHSFLEALKDFPSRREVAGTDEFMQRLAILQREFIHILLREVEFVIVEQLEIGREKLG